MERKQVGEVLVRPARSGDEYEIANVHLNSWREAYRGLLPRQYLDQLPTAFRRRMKWWRKVIHELSDHVLYVAEARSGLVGFACFGPARDEDRDGSIEIGAIYLLECHKGKGIGRSLLQSGFEIAASRGFGSAYCWVLENNPTIKFYENSGGIFSGKKKEDEIGGKKVTELAYVWEALPRASEPYYLRLAKSADLTFVTKLHHQTLREYVEPVWGWDEAKQDTFVKNWFKPEKVQIIQKSSEDVGLLVVEDRNDDLYLGSISTVPGMQGRGIGSAVIQDVIARASFEEKPLRLQVLKTNPRARRLYEKLGFRLERETDHHYEMKRDPCRATN